MTGLPRPVTRLIRAVVDHGSLTILDDCGRRHDFGPGGGGPAVTVRLRDRRTAWRLLVDPTLAVGEAYMAGTLTIEQGTLADLMAMVAARSAGLYHRFPASLMIGLARWSRRWLSPNDRRRARRNIARHYDLPGDLYDLFLDRDRTYSCAYFRDGADTLEAAQAAKLDHIADKLVLRPGQTVLDIGCGWGGLATRLATDRGAKVTGITLSSEQLQFARARAATVRLADKVRFRLQDYRDVDGRFDRIVSVGMLEHVGKAGLGAFFAKVAALLAEDGVALVHAIGRADADTGPDRWIDRYIFPGGHIPALSEVIPAVERSGLWIADVEIWRLHYADTLRHWARRFQANRAKAARLIGERGCRMWEFYLAMAEAGFRHGPLMVFQLQLARRRDAVPLTRDYLYPAGRARPAQSAQSAGRGG